MGVVFDPVLGSVRSGATTAGDVAKASGRLAVYPDFFGPITGAGSGDTLKKAHDYAIASGIYEVALNGKKYEFDTNITWNPAVKLSGAGYQKSGGATTLGSVLKRTADVTFSVIGTSVNAGGPHNAAFNMCDFAFEGGDRTATLFELKATSYARISNVFFAASNQRLVDMTEFFDSDFLDCHFEWGGTSDGTHPMIALNSNLNGFEFTNQVRFTNCRMESYRGHAIRSFGTGTNEIYFTATKMESVQSNLAALYLYECTGVHFNLLQVASCGNNTGTIDSAILLENCRHVTGSIHMEHFGAVRSPMSSYIKKVNSGNLNLNVNIYGNYTTTSGKAVGGDAINNGTCIINVQTTISGMATAGRINVAPVPTGCALLPSHYLSASSSTPSTAGATTYVPIDVENITTYTAAGVGLTTAQAGGEIRVAVYDIDANGRPGALIQTLGTIDLSTGSGIKTGAISWTPSRLGRYWLYVAVKPANPQVTVSRLASVLPNYIQWAPSGLTASIVPLRYYTSTDAYGSAPPATPTSLNASGGGDCPVVFLAN